MTKNDWCCCHYCGHKLFKVKEAVTGVIEIKCPSCKRIYAIDLAKRPPQERLFTISTKKYGSK